MFFSRPRPCRALQHLSATAPRLSSANSPRGLLPRRTYASSGEPRVQRNVIGAFSPTSAVLFVGVGISLIVYLRYIKQKRLEELEQERAEKSYGRPNVGGPFTLTNCKTKESFSAPEGLLGKWSLVYFGFTNCPDICPAELDKVTVVLNDLKQDPNASKHNFQPLFISVDPARDTPEQIALYLQDFHPDYIGLVGSYADTKAVCKAYRVYFSTPPNADPKGDYLVDHSIFVYLMDPQGKFVDAFGQAFTREDMVAKTTKALKEWEEEQGSR